MIHLKVHNAQGQTMDEMLNYNGATPELRPAHEENMANWSDCDYCRIVQTKCLHGRLTRNTRRNMTSFF